MKSFARIFFFILLVNVAVFGLGFMAPPLLILLLVAVPIELLVGLVLLFNERYREIGLALLASAGVLLLVAGFICSSMSYNFH